MQKIKTITRDRRDLVKYFSECLLDAYEDGALLPEGINPVDTFTNRTTFARLLMEGYSVMMITDFDEVEKLVDSGSPFVLVVTSNDEVWDIVYGENIMF